MRAMVDEVGSTPEQRAVLERVDAVIWASNLTYDGGAVTVTNPPPDHYEAVVVLRAAIEKTFPSLKSWADAATAFAAIESAQAMATRMGVPDALLATKNQRMEVTKKLVSAWSDLNRIPNLDIRPLLVAYLQCLRVIAGADQAGPIDLGGR